MLNLTQINYVCPPKDAAVGKNLLANNEKAKIALLTNSVELEDNVVYQALEDNAAVKIIIQVVGKNLLANNEKEKLALMGGR